METTNKEEFFEKALQVKWKVGICNTGESCWCRTIIPIGVESEDYYIIPEGTMHREVVEHIVNIHNNSLNLEH